jgi:ribonuclease P protein component
MGINNEKDAYNHNQSKKKENAWLPFQNGDQRRPVGSQQEKGQGEAETDRIKQRFQKKPGENHRIPGSRFYLKMRKESFRPQERIRKKKDFDLIYRYGSRLYSKNFTVLLYQNPRTGSSAILSDQRRLGVAVGKKVGHSVTRNRIKRLLREFFRRNKEQLPAGRDILIIVRKNASIRSYQDVCVELGNILFGTANN